MRGEAGPLKHVELAGLYSSTTASVSICWVVCSLFDSRVELGTFRPGLVGLHPLPQVRHRLLTVELAVDVNERNLAASPPLQHECRSGGKIKL